MIRRSGSPGTVRTALLAAVALVVLLAGCEGPASDPVGPEGTTLLEGYPTAHAEVGDGDFLGKATEPEPDDGQTSQILVSLGSVCVTVTFEDQSHLTHPVLPPGAGATFSPNWVVVSLAHNQPSPTNLATWSNGSTAEVVFDPAIARAHFYYSTFPGAGTTLVEALDASGNVLAGASLPETAFQVWELASLDVEANNINTLRLTGVASKLGIDDLTFCREDEAIEVEADVKPGNDDEIDPTNLNQKNVPLAVFTTSDFDAAEVDPGSLLVSDPGFPSGAVGVSDARREDVDEDGDLDLLVFFDVKAMADAGGIDGTTVQLVLTGETTDGRTIVGIDDVRVVGNP